MGYEALEESHLLAKGRKKRRRGAEGTQSQHGEEVGGVASAQGEEGEEGDGEEVEEYRAFGIASHSLPLLHEGFCHQVQFHWFRA